MLAKLDIRLLKVLPGNPISFELLHVKLSQAPGYCALSYTWGCPKKQVSIQVNGRELFVTENLGHALHHFCPLLRKAGYLIWADAICINQDCVAERARQVLLMQTIYQSAAVVNVWLGFRDNVSVKENLLPFQKLVQVEQLMELQGGCTGHPDLSQQTLYPGQLGSASEKAWKGIFDLLATPWWRRAWVLQEASTTVPTLFYYGRVGIQTRYFQALFDFLSGLLPLLQDNTIAQPLSHLDRVLRVRSTRLYGLYSSPLESMHFLRSTDCADPRDRVYATYGLVSVSAGLGWDRAVPRYDASVTEVYTAAIDQLVEESPYGRQLDFLGYVSHTNPPTSDLPTFLPDWRTPFPGLPLPKYLAYALGDPSARVYAAGGSGPADISITDTSLVLAGYTLDAITHIAVSPLAAFLTGATIAHVDPRIYPGEKFFDVLVRTATADVEFDPHGGDGALRRGVDVGRFMDGCLNDQDTLLAADAELMRRLEGSPALQGRRLCITAAGWLGLVPRAARIDDEVCVFPGGSVLYILRPQGERFGFVGEAFFHTLMDGEFLRWKTGAAERFVIV